MDDIRQALEADLALAKQRGFIRARRTIEDRIREHVEVILELRKFRTWKEIADTLRRVGIEANERTIERAVKKIVRGDAASTSPPRKRRNRAGLAKNGQPGVPPLPPAPPLLPAPPPPPAAASKNGELPDRQTITVTKPFAAKDRKV